MVRNYPSFGTNVPPNTPARAKRRMVNFDFTNLKGGMKDVMNWQGDDERDRGKLRRLPTPTYSILKINSHRLQEVNEPDHTNYNPSWANTIPNRGFKTFTMNDTLFLHPKTAGNKSDMKVANSEEPLRLMGSRSPTKLNLYSEIPQELERQKSNIYSRNALPSRRPGIIDTIGAADRAIRHVQAKREREDMVFDNIIKLHHNRFENVHAQNQLFSNMLTGNKSTDHQTPSPSPRDHWEKLNWKSKLSRHYKEDYIDLLQRYQIEHKNVNSGIVKDFYKENERGLATKMDVRHYHHVI